MSWLWGTPNPHSKMLYIINPLNHPVLPFSIQSPEDQQNHVTPPEIDFEYPRLKKGNPTDQFLSITSLLSHHIPSYRTFLPILSFSTKQDFFDLPIPCLPDYVMCFKDVIPGLYCMLFLSVAYRDYCDSIINITKEIDAHPIPYTQKTNSLFFRGNCLSSYGIPSILSAAKANSSLYNVQIIRPNGLVESTVTGLTCITDNRYSRNYIKES